jgi:hypothetical protein
VSDSPHVTSLAQQIVPDNVMLSHVFHTTFNRIWPEYVVQLAETCDFMKCVNKIMSVLGEHCCTN